MIEPMCILKAVHTEAWLQFMEVDPSFYNASFFSSRPRENKMFHFSKLHFRRMMVNFLAYLIVLISHYNLVQTRVEMESDRHYIGVEHANLDQP